MEHHTTTMGSRRTAAPREIVPTEKLRNCINECTDCHGICVEAASHCLSQGGQHAEAGRIRLLRDCAEFCQTSANFMLRGSPFHVHVCLTCAQLCLWCAEDCEQVGGDEQMRACTEACRRCAEACGRVIEEAAR